MPQTLTDAGAKYVPFVNPSAHERAEWSRLAQQAYSRGFNAWGHRYSVAAAISAPITLAAYDALQLNYRIWLVKGFDAAGQLVRN
jgi:hypothetical protein